MMNTAHWRSFPKVCSKFFLIFYSFKNCKINFLYSNWLYKWIYILNDLLFSGHGSLCQIMQARLQNLSLVSRLWTDGDIKVYSVTLFSFFHFLKKMIPKWFQVFNLIIFYKNGIYFCPTLWYRRFNKSTGSHLVSNFKLYDDVYVINFLHYDRVQSTQQAVCLTCQCLSIWSTSWY